MGSKNIVKIGNIKIGGGNRIAIQSMLNIPADDVDNSVKQAVALENAGCEIIRAAIPNKDAVKIKSELIPVISVPMTG